MNHNLLPNVFFIIFAVLMGFQSTKYGLGKVGDPGPGFLPLFSSICIGLLSLGQLVSQFHKGEKDKSQRFKLGPLWQRAFYLMGLSFLFVIILWERLGFIISTTLWFISILWVGGIRSWKKILLIVISVITLSYLVFEKIAQLPLPKGLLGF